LFFKQHFGAIIWESQWEFTCFPWGFSAWDVAVEIVLPVIVKYLKENNLFFFVRASVRIFEA